LADFIFEWDTEKDRINHQKHKIWFDEAVTVFEDVNIKFHPDNEHSQDEDLFIAIGFCNVPRLLLVCHCYRGDGTRIRIISARKADRSESALYGGEI